MNIAEVCLNSSLGGLELYFYWCCEYFQTSSQHNLVGITVPGSRLQNLLQESQISTELVDRGFLVSNVKAAFRLARIFEDRRIDVVHVHFAKDLPLVALAKKISRQKVSLIHTRQMEMPGSKKDVYHRWVYSQVDHLICVTDKLKNDVLERVAVAPQKVSRLYYGVPKPLPNPERQLQFLTTFPSNLLKVAMFSRLEKSKGQWRLLKALSQLKTQGVPFQIYFFGHFMGGDGYEEFLKQTIQEYNLTDHVFWCGFQKKPQELMSCFDVVALPSDQETFGLVLIEAMAAGVSVIGSRAGGVPEIITDGKTGFTFDPDDLEEFAQKLKILLSDENLRKSFASAGFKKYLQFFRAEDHYQELEKSMLRLVEER